MCIELNFVQYEYQLKWPGNIVQNGHKWTNLIAVYKFFVNNIALVCDNILKFVDKLDNIL